MSRNMHIVGQTATRTEVPRTGQERWKSADKPGSVEGSHSSGTAVADGL